MTTDLRVLIADTLAAHEDVITNMRTVACTCGEWSMPFDHLGITEVAAEHRLHRADAVLGVLDGRLLPDGGETREEWGVWWHADSANGIVLDAHQLRSRDEAQRVGEWRPGRAGRQA